MDLTRRDFLGVCGGGAAFAVLAGLGLRPRTAYAVAGIDDVALGGLVLLVATLGGYAVSRSVANASLQALGYGFSDFVSDAGNQAAAVTQTLADANNLSVELSRSNAEQAAASIAAGTGYFAEVMGNAATTGRVALDNFLSGASELPGVLRNLVAGYLASPQFSGGIGVGLLPGAVVSDAVAPGISFDLASVVGDKVLAVYVAPDAAIMSRFGVSDKNYKWCAYVHSDRPNGNYNDEQIVFGTNDITRMEVAVGMLGVYMTCQGSYLRYRNSDGSLYGLNTTSTPSLYVPSNTGYTGYIVFGESMVTGGALPVVDRAADAPDVIGPGYDSLPLGNDLVIDPSTNDVVSAGSLPLPTGIPDVFGDFVGTLEDLLAGVVPGVIGLPVSVSEPVVVGTAEGVTSMPISEAIATETSLAAPLEPPSPAPPPGTVDPPVTVPEGPWTPAVALPFAQLWPFNMIYSFVQLFEDLGA